MTIYHQGTARVACELPVTLAERVARESGPGEKRTCEDVFAAMQRLIDAQDPSTRD